MSNNLKVPQTAHEMTIANLDGDVMTGYEQQTADNGDIMSQPAQRFAFDGKIDFHDIDARADTARNAEMPPPLPRPEDPLSAEEIRAQIDKDAQARKLPTPWDKPPTPTPGGY